MSGKVVPHGCDSSAALGRAFALSEGGMSTLSPSLVGWRYSLEAILIFEDFDHYFTLLTRWLYHSWVNPSSSSNPSHSMLSVSCSASL